MHVWLIGMMGAGKTMVGRLLADALALRFVDTDAEVEREVGESVADLWDAGGEDAFRSRESRVIADLVTAGPAVVATGGGSILDPESVSKMRASGVVIWLDASVPSLVDRLGRTSGRPLLAGDDLTATLQRLADRRRSSYAEAAHHRVESDRPAEEVVDEIRQLLP